MVMDVRPTIVEDSPRRTGASKMSKIGGIVSASYSCSVTAATDIVEDSRAGKDCTTLPDELRWSALTKGRRRENMAGSDIASAEPAFIY